MIKRELFFELPKASEASITPEWIQIIPSGEITGRDGRHFNNSSPDLIIENFIKNESPLPIDYEHATEAEEYGVLAPAMGWVVSLENRNGEIWGQVDWTPRGAEFVKNREYRFISPSFWAKDDTGDITSLSSIALTNKPNLKLKALSKALNIEDTVMPISENPEELPALVVKIVEILGLSENATAEDILTAITNLTEGGEPSGEEEMTENEKVELQKYKIGYEQLQDLVKQTETRANQAEKKINLLQEEVNNAKIKAVIESNGANRITPAMRNGIEKLAQYLCKDSGVEKGLELLKAHIDSIPEFDKKVVYAQERLNGMDEVKKIADNIAKGAR